jgi:hypothetical protein
MKSAWTRLTPSDLQSRLSRREMEAIRRAAGAWDDAAAQEILDQTADTARGYIASSAANALDPAPHTVPPELRAACLDIALVDYSQSIGGVLLDPQGGRQKAADRALKRLEAAAAGRFALTPPSDAAPGSPAPRPPTAYKKPTLLTRPDQKGSW